ncbi:hypothetical protein [Actinosynnema sp. NPDC020468]|uniref:hypothetical protein n=1 Tax=Actinosynnema sp. NPDC020468 TaxID=3154488 RepID=UPI0033D6A678
MAAVVGDLPGVRARWQEVVREQPAAVVRISLLASYTIDPVLPYLGVALHDAGLPMDAHVGPYNQIVQQCLDDASPSARHRPDVLVVAPRFEELGEESGHASGLRAAVDAADGAASRWGALLVVVLPPLPTRRSALAEGLPQPAVAAREAERARLAARPDVLVVDGEQAVRAVGSRQAHHEALFRFAKVPYVEQVFAELASRLAKAVKAVFGATPRAVVVDAAAPGVEDLVDDLRLLRGLGVRVALTDRVDALLDVVDGWSSAEPDVRDASDLDRLGVFDRLPAVPPERVDPVGPVSDGVSLADFVAGLDVRVTCEPVGPDTAEKVAEVVGRAKDFTLGGAPDLADPTRIVLAVRVADRLGDYGVSGAIGLRREGEDWAVDVFSLSCPVLGKGVEDRVVAEILATTGGRVVFRHERTPHNDVATRFLDRTDLSVEER